MYVSETVNNIEKLDELEINKIINYISSESSYGIEVVALQLINVDISQNEIPKSVAKSAMNLKLSRDIKPIIISNGFSKNLKSSHKKKIITNILFTFCLKIERLKKEDSSNKLLDPEGNLSIINAINS